MTVRTYLRDSTPDTNTVERQSDPRGSNLLVRMPGQPKRLRSKGPKERSTTTRWDCQLTRLVRYHRITRRVRALIGHAMGDFVSVQNSLREYVAEANQPCTNLDLTLGLSSVLVGCSILAEAIPDHALVNRTPLIVLGNRIAEKIEDELANYAAIAECKAVAMLGIAHGWAGFLYALMQWKRTQGKEPGDGIRARLQQLEELGEERGTGMRWKIRLDARRRSPTQYMTGWCNGSAGMVFLWTLANEAYREVRFLKLAEKAAR